MTFAAMKTELIARGFDGLASNGLTADTRAGVYINAARAEFDRMFLWPWREKSATGTSPLSITDLGTIEKVIDTSNSSVALARADYSSLVDAYGDLSPSGSPSFYYVAWPSGTPEVVAYPGGSHTIGVQYWRVTPDLSSGSDTPASPAECHYTIVDMAVRRAYRDNDDHDSAAAIQAEIDLAIGQFLFAYPPGIADGPDAYVGVTGASEDW